MHRVTLVLEAETPIDPATVEAIIRTIDVPYFTKIEAEIFTGAVTAIGADR